MNLFGLLCLLVSTVLVNDYQLQTIPFNFPPNFIIHWKQNLLDFTRWICSRGKGPSCYLQ
uniref:Uncharacterized protein n=1 Tax=Tetranychus urticae TaxID=32264 RepID=T1KRC2_TETUR